MGIENEIDDTGTDAHVPTFEELAALAAVEKLTEGASDANDIHIVRNAGKSEKKDTRPIFTDDPVEAVLRQYEGAAKKHFPVPDDTSLRERG